MADSIAPDAPRVKKNIGNAEVQLRGEDKPTPVKDYQKD
jgi:hypothetical protein